MVQQHNFKLFPELTNNQLNIFYFESPHRQITEDFHGFVTKVTDGDTIHIKWNQREKPIVIRLVGIAAAEIKEKDGVKSQRWLENKVGGKEVEIVLDEERVGKWGRILGTVIQAGFNINYESLETGHSIPFEEDQEIKQIFSIPRIA